MKQVLHLMYIHTLIKHLSLYRSFPSNVTFRSKYRPQPGDFESHITDNGWDRRKKNSEGYATLCANKSKMDAKENSFISNADVLHLALFSPGKKKSYMFSDDSEVKKARDMDNADVLSMSLLRSASKKKERSEDDSLCNISNYMDTSCDGMDFDDIGETESTKSKPRKNGHSPDKIPNCKSASASRTPLSVLASPSKSLTPLEQFVESSERESLIKVLKNRVSEGIYYQLLSMLNTSVIDDLLLLRTIGHKRAAAIIERRSKSKFRKAEDLFDIGMSEKEVVKFLRQNASLCLQPST